MTGRWMRFVAIAVFLVGSNGIAMPSTAFAGAQQGGCTKKGNAVGKQVSSDSLGRTYAELASKGMSATAVEDKLRTDWCVRRITGPGVSEVTTLSSWANDVKFDTANLFYDDDLHHYYAVGMYRWLNHDYAGDEQNDNCGVNDAVGGHDGFGVRITGDGYYNNFTSSAYVWGDDALDSYSNDYGVVQLTTSTPTVERNLNEHGVFYRFQDNVISMQSGFVCHAGTLDYDMFGGVVVYQFDLVEAPGVSCRAVTAKGTYFHTWESNFFSGEITGVSIGPWSFGLSWNHDDLKWEAEPAASAPDIMICPNRTISGAWTGYKPPSNGGGCCSQPPGSAFRQFLDINSDGKADVLGVNSAGDMHRWLGDGAGWINHGGVVGGGWNSYGQFRAPGDINGDGKTDLIAVDSATGDMYRWHGDGYSIVFGGLIGGGWNSYDVIAGRDINRDGWPDLLGINKSTGEMHRWYGNGYSFNYGGVIGGGWSSYDVIAPGDINSDGKADLFGIQKSTGDLHRWYGNGTGSYSYGGVLGGGWQNYTIFPVGDLNGDKKADILGIHKSTGDMHRFYGDGGGWISHAGVIGGGWLSYTLVG